MVARYPLALLGLLLVAPAGARAATTSGDETQAACPAEASLQVASCTADIALTVAGPAFGVVDRDTPYDVTTARRSTRWSPRRASRRRRSRSPARHA